MGRCRFPWILVFALAGGLGSAGAAAQTTRPAPPAGDEAARPLLAGPEVPDAAARTTDAGFSGRRRRAVTVPPRRWFAALRGLDLSEEQQQEAAAVARELQRAQRDHQRAHGAEIRRLRGMVREARRAGTAPPPEVREELARLNAIAPRAGKYQQRAWDLLDGAQREQMRAELSEIRRQIARRRAAGRDAMTSPPRDAATRGRDRASENGGPQLDELGRRRLEFLRSRQTRSPSP